MNTREGEPSSCEKVANKSRKTHLRLLVPEEEAPLQIQYTCSNKTFINSKHRLIERNGTYELVLDTEYSEYENNFISPDNLSESSVDEFFKYYNLLRILKSGAKSQAAHSHESLNKSLLVYQEPKPDLSTRITQMEGIYLVEESIPATLPIIKDHLEDDFDDIYSDLNKLKPAIKVANQHSSEQLKKNPNIFIAQEMLNIASLFPQISAGQRKRLLMLAGYSQEEAQKLAIELFVSGGISLLFGGAYESLGLSAAAWGAGHPFVEPFANPLENPAAFLTTLGTVVGSYGLYWGSMLFNADRNVKLLKNQKLGTSPIFTATLTYHLLNKLLPEDKCLSEEEETDTSKYNILQKGLSHVRRKFFNKREDCLDNSTKLAAVALEPTREWGWIGSILIPGVGPSMFVAGNLMGFVLNATQGLGSHILSKKLSQNN